MPAQQLLRSPQLRIVAAGCTHRLEQRILQETNYFHELERYFPHSDIRLCMVGPEIRVSNMQRGKMKRKGKKKRGGKPSPEWVHESKRFAWCVERGTVRAFLRSKVICHTTSLQQHSGG
jgi:hypothetical protein